MFRSVPAISLALLLVPVPLRAEITADALWQMWQGGGGPVEAARVGREAGALVLDDVTVRRNGIAYVADRVSLSDRPDGRVAVAVEGPIAVAIAALPGDAEIRVDPVGAEIFVDLVEGDLSYEIAAETVTAGLSQAGMPMADYRLVDLDARVAVDAESGAMRAATASAARLVAHIVLPDGPGTEIDLRLDGLRGGATSKGPRDLDAEATFEAMTLDLESVVVRAPLDVTLRGGEGRLSGGLADLAATMRLDLGKVLATATGDAVPRDEGAVTIGSLRFGAIVPAFADTDPVPVSLDIDAEDVVPTAAYWARLDPDAALPRDPMQVHLGVTGEARLPRGDTETWEETVPYLTLDSMRVSGLGTEITGEGRVDMPISREEAKGDLAFVATGLLDTIGALAQSGLLMPGAELGARMGLAFATVPDPDGNGLLSEVRFGPDGAIRMNQITLR